MNATLAYQSKEKCEFSEGENNVTDKEVSCLSSFPVFEIIPIEHWRAYVAHPNFSDGTAESHVLATQSTVYDEP